MPFERVDILRTVRLEARRDARGMGQEMADRDVTDALVGDHEVRDVANDGGIKLDQTALDELHDGQRRHAFGRRPNHDRRIGGHERARFAIRLAVSRDVDDLSFGDDHKREARYVPGSHPLLNVGIDRRSKERLNRARGGADWR